MLSDWGIELQSKDLFSLAMSHYALKGYRYLTVPELVDKDVLLSTTTEEQVLWYTKTKGYVGSAEQSFLQLAKEGKLEKGKHQALTDCYRPLDQGLPLHYPRFKKLELIWWGSSLQENYLYVLCDAYDFFVSLTSEDKIKVVETEEGHDLECNGIEIGSYGIRTFLNTNYIYGTGLALPRFTDTLNQE